MAEIIHRSEDGTSLLETKILFLEQKIPIIPLWNGIIGAYAHSYNHKDDSPQQGKEAKSYPSGGDSKTDKISFIHVSYIF